MFLDKEKFDEKMQLCEKELSDFEKIERAYISLYRYLEINNKLDESSLYNKEYYNEFIMEMAHDFNTPNAITVLYKLLKEINVMLRQKEKNDELLNQYLKTLEVMFYVLGFVVNIKKLNSSELTLVNSWYQARNEKNFALADELRKEITEKGIVL